jgi:hypothetical protein
MTFVLSLNLADRPGLPLGYDAQATDETAQGKSVY